MVWTGEDAELRCWANTETATQLAPDLEFLEWRGGRH